MLRRRAEVAWTKGKLLSLLMRTTNDGGLNVLAVVNGGDDADFANVSAVVRTRRVQSHRSCKQVREYFAISVQ